MSPIASNGGNRDVNRHADLDGMVSNPEFDPEEAQVVDVEVIRVGEA